MRRSRGQEAQDSPEHDDSLGKLTHYNCLTLPHLVALISRPTARIVPNDVSLVVVSAVTALINSALPKTQDDRVSSKLNRGRLRIHQPWLRDVSNPNKTGPNASAKRRQALQSIIKALQTLASTRNCAVVILSQCATKMQSERGATLTPAINANLWEQGVSTRLTLFRDWTWRNNKSATVFLAGLQKLDGKATQDVVENVSAFKIDAVSRVASLRPRCLFANILH